MRHKTTAGWSWSRLLAVLGGALLLLLATAVPAGAGPVTPVQWHRYNVYEPDAPSHERLRCLTDGEWRCLYDTVPEPVMGFSNPSVKARFVGTDITTDWACPDWFTSEICGSVVRAIAGTQTFIEPGAGVIFEVDVVLLLTDDGALWDYWVGQFVCPWYPTLEEAIASFPAEDCIFA
jgi:hypothetical protein